MVNVIIHTDYGSILSDFFAVASWFPSGRGNAAVFFPPTLFLLFFFLAVF